jgi:DNA-binding transcriptional ArsR family regulator
MGKQQKKASQKASSVPVENCTELACVFKFLGHPQRIRLLFCLLQFEALSVMELSVQTGMSQSQVSQVLQKFKLMDVLESDREGQMVLYRIKCQKMKKLLHKLLEIYPLAEKSF